MAWLQNLRQMKRRAEDRESRIHTQGTPKLGDLMVSENIRTPRGDISDGITAYFECSPEIGFTMSWQDFENTYKRLLNLRKAK